MRVTHTTTLKRLASIRQFGFLVTFARQGRRAVWFHSKLKDKWAEAHVRCRHDAYSEDLVHIEVDVPRSWCRRHAGGIWYVLRDVPADRIRRIRSVRTVEEVISL